MRFILPLTTAAMLALVGPIAVSPAGVTISTFDNTGYGFGGGDGADTSIHEGLPNSAPGAAEAVIVRNQTDSIQEVGYYRFDLSQIDKSSLRGAKLQVWDYRTPASAGGYGTLDGHTFDIWALVDESQDNWAEGSTSWNTAPGHTDDGLPFDDADFDANTAHLGTFTYSRAMAGHPLSIPADVPGLLSAIQSDTNNQLTLMMTGPAGLATAFRTGTKESERISIWTANPPLAEETILPGQAATRLVLDNGTTTVTTFDHDGDGVASGGGADTFISENAPGSIYGARGDFQVRDNRPGDGSGQEIQQVGYLKFDLAAVDTSETGYAWLQLYDYRFNEGGFNGQMHNQEFTVWALLDDAGQDDWDESTVSWNDAPGHADDGNPFNGPDFTGDVVEVGKLLFESETTAHGWGAPSLQMNLVPLIQNDTDGLLTLMITGPRSGTGALFYLGSKESVLNARINNQAIPAGLIAPRLILARVPEPSAAVLACMGALLAVFGTRRRR